MTVCFHISAWTKCVSTVGLRYPCPVCPLFLVHVFSCRSALRLYSSTCCADPFLSSTVTSVSCYSWMLITYWAPLICLYTCACKDDAGIPKLSGVSAGIHQQTFLFNHYLKYINTLYIKYYHVYIRYVKMNMFEAVLVFISNRDIIKYPAYIDVGNILSYWWLILVIDDSAVILWWQTVKGPICNTDTDRNQKLISQSMCLQFKYKIALVDFYYSFKDMRMKVLD